MADVERIAGRVAMNRTSPRDLNALGMTLHSLPALVGELRGGRPALIEELANDFGGFDELAGFLRRAIRDDPPPGLREGGFIAEGFDAELDRLRAVGSDGQSWLIDYQRREIERTGIAHLKVGFNRVFGYYIEISNANRGKVPSDYVRRQTVKNAERYITEDLKRFEDDVLTAKDRANEREFALFEEIRGRIATFVPALLRAAGALATLDVLAGWAELAVQRRYVRPEIVEDGRLEIRDGRHPVLDQILSDAFVPNDTLMTGCDSRVFVITGPNMAGKSTYVRQVALLTLLAQVGSFVPAAGISFSVVDRLFARVGSSDEIMRGQSTFMVEMIEAARILHSATKSSLVILDELGRGTSTFDGLALAWAITEHLSATVGCRTLVATHYHELIELGSLMKNVKNYNVAVREYPASKGKEAGIAFLHRVVEGGASQSYGLHVARLAGIPQSVLDRGRDVLGELQRAFEKESHTPSLSRRKTRDDAQLNLFQAPGEELIRELSETDPARLTPLDALQKISQWKEKFSP